MCVRASTLPRWASRRAHVVHKLGQSDPQCFGSNWWLKCVIKCGPTVSVTRGGAGGRDRIPNRESSARLSALYSQSPTFSPL